MQHFLSTIDWTRAELDDLLKVAAELKVEPIRNSLAGQSFALTITPVDDDARTFDLPFDETFKLSAGYFWQGDRHLDFAIGGTLYLIDDASIDQTSQGVRAKGESDENVILFLGGRLRYVF